MRPLLVLALMVLLLGTGALGSASAQEVNAPPGLSGVDEYLETVPGAGGAERPGGGAAKPLDDPAVAAKAKAAVPQATVDALRKAGADGERAAALAATSSPESARSAPSGPGGGVPLADGVSPSAPGRIAGVVTGGSGAGWLLPALLGALTALLIGAAVLRRRAA